ncbi:protease [Bottlenose dolphin adenovirus 1]|uniref:Protease n=1 Tax=Bottlenose dolphin adenovirus 1 TaxID=1714377 RepID=A0A1X7MNZ3_9ADEN|nr:protease [Bottlenose dolphin adenovirus 1]SMG83450.1 protease [Bottlenose dolphin adenovirus 1]
MGSTEEELKAMASDLGITPFFLGIFDKTFPGFIHKSKMCCAIINTAARETGGVHWLALGWFPAKNTFYFFDPFGFSNSKLEQMYTFEYEGLLRRSAITSTPSHSLTLIKSKEAVQGPYSAACGLFCLMFLHSFVNWPQTPMDNNPTANLIHGIPSNSLFDPQFAQILYNNQKKLYEFLYANSKYFRTHEKQIQFQTAFNKALETYKKALRVF